MRDVSFRFRAGFIDAIGYARLPIVCGGRQPTVSSVSGYEVFDGETPRKNNYTNRGPKGANAGFYVKVEEFKILFYLLNNRN